MIARSLQTACLQTSNLLRGFQSCFLLKFRCWHWLCWAWEDAQLPCEVHVSTCWWLLECWSLVRLLRLGCRFVSKMWFRKRIVGLWNAKTVLATFSISAHQTFQTRQKVILPLSRLSTPLLELEILHPIQNSRWNNRSIPTPQTC